MPIRAKERLVLEEEKGTVKNQIRRRNVLRYRKRGKLQKNISKLLSIYNRISVWSTVLSELEKEGLLVNEEDRVYFTPKGIFWETMCLNAFY